MPSCYLQTVSIISVGHLNRSQYYEARYQQWLFAYDTILLHDRGDSCLESGEA